MERIRLRTLTVILVAAVVVTATPVLASHTAVVSIHTTATDFNNAATLTNGEVVGAEEGASVDAYTPTVIDDFENGFDAEWGGNTGQATTTSTVSVNGDDALELTAPGNGDTWIARDDHTTTTDTNYTAYVRAQRGDMAPWFCILSQQTDSTPGGYCAEIHVESGTFSALEVWYMDTSGSKFSGPKANPPSELKDDTWYKIVMQANSTGYVTAHLYEKDGTYLTTAEGDTIGSYSSGGVALSAQETGGTGDTEAFFDFITAPTDDTATYVSDNHAATDPQQGFTNFTLDNNAEATVTWEEHTGGTWSEVRQDTYTTGGNKSVDISAATGDTLRVNVTFTSTGDDPDAELYDEGVTAPTHGPVLDDSSASPKGGTVVSEDPVTLEIDLTDADFPTAQGDSVDVEFFVNGTSEGTDTLTSNGTATIDVTPDELGNAEWHAEATDDYGHTDTSSTFQFETPSSLTIRNETNATEVITGTSATITFYNVDGTVVVEKTDSDGNGKISLAGLPNDAFVAVIQADGWHDRRIYIDSIFQQDNVFLLNSTRYPTGNDSAIETTFVYEDRTGEFDQANTTLEIERAVDVDGDGTYNWTVVAGDFWGAAGEFPFTGEQRGRYRLRITNQETGESRLLGTHIPVNDGVKNIIVGKVIFQAENATGRYWNASINQNTTNLQAYYNDPTDGTTDLTISIHEQGNESNEIYNQTFSGPVGEKTVQVSLTEAQTEKNWVVEFDGTHDSDGSVFGKVLVGGAEYPLPIDPDILAAFVYVMVTFVMALYGPRTAVLGAWAGVAAFGGAAFLGWVSGVTLAVPVVVAIGATFYNEAMP